MPRGPARRYLHAEFKIIKILIPEGKRYEPHMRPTFECFGQISVRYVLDDDNLETSAV